MGTFHEIANRLPKLSVLELGIGNKQAFNSLKTSDKISVDVNSRARPDFCGNTDEFFRRNTRRFDLVYIDADHNHECALRDFNNAQKVSRFVFMHDVFPPDEGHCARTLCEDSYKILSHLIWNGDENFAYTSHDYGTLFCWDSGPIESFESGGVAYRSFFNLASSGEKIYEKEKFIAFVVNKIQENS